jgi:hypothetical protein
VSRSILVRPFSAADAFEIVMPSVAGAPEALAPPLPEETAAVDLETDGMGSSFISSAILIGHGVEIYRSGGSAKYRWGVFAAAAFEFDARTAGTRRATGRLDGIGRIGLALFCKIRWCAVFMDFRRPPAHGGDWFEQGGFGRFSRSFCRAMDGL